MPIVPITPPFENPYPDGDWDTISDFRYETPLVLYRGIDAVRNRDGEDADYILFKDYTISYTLDGSARSITVPRGMVTDLSTVPRGLRNIVDRVGPHLEASIVHDFLYIAWQVKGRGAHRADWTFADKLMRAGLRSAKVRRSQILAIYAALRTAGWFVYRDRNDGPFFVDVDQL